MVFFVLVNMTHIYFSEARSSICGKKGKKKFWEKINFAMLKTSRGTSLHTYPAPSHDIKGCFFVFVFRNKTYSNRIIFQFSSEQRRKYLHYEVFPTEQIKTYSMFLPAILHLRIKKYF